MGSRHASRLSICCQSPSSVDRPVVSACLRPVCSYLNAVSYHITRDGQVLRAFLRVWVSWVSTRRGVEYVCVAMDFGFWRRRKWAVIPPVQDDRAPRCVYWEERRFPLDSIISRLFEDQAQAELVGYIRNMKQVGALGQASNNECM